MHLCSYGQSLCRYCLATAHAALSIRRLIEAFIFHADDIGSELYLADIGAKINRAKDLIYITSVCTMHLVPLQAGELVAYCFLSRRLGSVIWFSFGDATTCGIKISPLSHFLSSWFLARHVSSLAGNLRPTPGWPVSLSVSGYGAIGHYFVLETANIDEVSRWGGAMFATSLCTNIIVTFLTAFRIW